MSISTIVVVLLLAQYATSLEYIDLSKTDVLMFSVGEMAYIHNGTIAVPQLQCVSSSIACNEARVTTIGCRNIGFDVNKRVMWRCETNSINRRVRSTNITCEKTDPTSYIAAKNSCYVQYKLEGEIDDLVVAVAIGVLILICVFCVILCFSDNNHRRHRHSYYGSGCDPLCMFLICTHATAHSMNSVTFSST
jgi:hypothetical protein